MPTVSSLFVYPIKSTRGISVLSLELDQRGPVFDRRFMVVDDRGKFITQRENPRMATISPRIVAESLVVSAPEMPDFELPPPADQLVAVEIWKFRCEAEDLGDVAARWFTDALEQSCRVVRFADSVHRTVSKKYSALDAEIGFADGYPLLVVSLESLAELNRRLEVPLPMQRFRPNVVVRDCQPFEEDEWRTVVAPELVFDVVKPCERCKIPTLNPETLEYGKEPLATLAKFRRDGAGVIFGQNAIHHGPGRLRVGDGLRIASRRTPERDAAHANPPRST